MLFSQIGVEVVGWLLDRLVLMCGLTRDIVRMEYEENLRLCSFVLALAPFDGGAITALYVDVLCCYQWEKDPD